MVPRPYKMNTRAKAVAQTRKDIVQAAMAVHADRGVLATSWEDIAETAGVSTPTVYRHFPSLAELVPACAQTVFDFIKPPSIEIAATQFAAFSTAADRLEKLVRESCRCYTLGEGWLHAAQREKDFVPELASAVAEMEETLGILVSAAAGHELNDEAKSTLFVLCDFPFWKSLVDSGMTREAAEETVVQIVRSEAIRLGLD